MKRLSFILLTVALATIGLRPVNAQNVNYSTGFESSDDNTEWVLLGGSQTNKWSIGSAAYSTGSGGLYVSSDNGTSASYTISSTSFAYAYYEFTLQQTAGLEISFDWKCYGEGNYDYIRVFLAPASATLTPGQTPDGGTSSNSFSTASAPTGWIDVSNGKLNLQSSWQTFSTTAGLSAGTWRLVFLWCNDGSVGTMPGGCIDNVSIVEPTCPRPDMFSAVYLTPDSCIISWRELGTASSWVIEYDSTNFVPGNNLGNVVYAYDTFYVLEYLEPSTTYHVYLHSDCGGDTSSNVLLTFTTACLGAQLPLIEDFASWTTSSGPYVGPCWSKGSTYSTGYPYVSTSYSHGDGKSLYFYSSGSSVYTYIAFPYVEEQASNLQISFWAYKTSSSYELQLGVMTDPSDISTFTAVRTISPTTTSVWVFFEEVPLSSYTGNGHYVAFRTMNNSSTSSMYIDDIELDILPTCLRPSNLTFSNITTDSCIITWHERGNATMWVVEYADSAFTPGVGQGTVEYVYDTMLVLEYLNASTEYHVYVHADCGGDTSRNVYGTFRTACTSATLPVTENFDNWETGSSSAYVTPCWHRGSNYSTTSYYPYATTSYAHSGSNSLYLYSTSSSWSYLALPFVSDPVNTLMVSFWIYKSNTSYTHAVNVGVMSNPEDVSTFTLVQTVTPASTSVWEYVEVPLTNYTGNGHYVALLSPDNVYCYPYIDDIYLDYIPTCATPTNFHMASNTSTSVKLEWTLDPNSTEYLIEYGASGFAYGTGTALTSYDDSIVVNSLTTGATYDFYLRSVCGAGDSSRVVGPVTATPGSWCTRAGMTDTVILCGGVLYDDGGPTASYSNGQTSTVILMPSGPGGVVSLQGTYTGEDCCDHLYVYDGVGRSGTLQLCEITSTSSGTQMTVGPFTSTDNSGALTVLFTSDGSVTNDGYILNVTCSSNTCPRVTNLAVASSTSTSATITWTAGGSESQWEVYDGTNRTYVSTPTHTLNSLTSGINYSVSVRPICSVGDTGLATSITFNLACPPTVVTAQGYTEGFESVSSGLPNCWIQDGTSDVWEVIDHGAYYNGTELNPHGGINTVLCESQSASVRLTSPVFDISALTSPKLTFWHMQEDWAGDQDELSVYARSGSSGAWTLLAHYTSSIDIWQCDTLSLAGYTNVQLSFLADCDYGYGIVLDDIFIGNIGGGSTPPCDAPTSLSTTTTTDNSATVSWSGSGSFEVSYKAASSSSWSTSTTVSTNNHTFTGLNAATQYDWRVRKVCGSSNYSSWASGSFTTQQGADPCDAPTGLSVTATTTSSATVTWTGSGQFEVSYKAASSSSWAPSTQVSTNSYNITGLNAATQYDWRVRRVCSNGDNSDWATGNFTTQQGGGGPDPCEAPTGLNVSNITTGSATVTWTGSGQFEVAYKTSASSSWGDATQVSANSCTFNGLIPATRYDWRVRKVCAADDYSDWMTGNFTTAGGGGDGISTADLGGVSVVIYPNPATNGSDVEVSIKGVDGVASVTLLDITGRTMQHSMQTCQADYTKRFDLHGVARGTYFVKVQTDTRISVQKLIVR